MKRLAVALLALAILAVPLAVEAQPGKVYRIGYVGTIPPPASMWDALLGGLRERGYVEGRNVVFEAASRRAGPSASPPWLPSWSSSRWTSSSSPAARRPPAL